MHQEDNKIYLTNIFENRSNTLVSTRDTETKRKQRTQITHIFVKLIASMLSLRIYKSKLNKFKIEGYNACVTMMYRNFRLLYTIKESTIQEGRPRFYDIFEPETRLLCIKSAILELTIYDTFDNDDMKDYYDKLPGHTISEKIQDRETFCREWTKYPPPDQEKYFENCCDELAVFGSDKEVILDKALREYRTSLIFSGDHTFWEGSFGNIYLRHIAGVVELKNNSNLITPGKFCKDNHPDNPNDQASSSYY